MPEYIYEILDILESNGHEAYVVGGCMRDIFLGVNPEDWDIATSALPNEVMHIFEKTIPTGLLHGTVTVLHNSIPVEITTYRTESGYSDSRHPDSVFFTSNLYDDLSRRDFTMNAIAYSPKRGLVDYFNGIMAIREGKIYCIGNSHDRFAEDALRMMRAVRFAAALNFTLDDSVLDAICKNHHLLERISMERIRDEFLKTVMSHHPEKFFLFTKTGLLKIFLAELHKLPHKTQKKIYISLKNIPSHRKIARLAALFSKLDPDIIPVILRRMRFDNTTIKAVSQVTRYLYFSYVNDVTIRKIASKIGTENVKNLIYVCDALNLLEKDIIDEARHHYDEILKNNYCLNIKSLAIGGQDLMALGFPEGKKIGTILNFLLEEVLINPSLNNKENLITIVKENF